MAIRLLAVQRFRFENLPPVRALHVAYDVILGHPLDPPAVSALIPRLRHGDLTNGELAQMLRFSSEFTKPGGYSENTLGYSIHAGRGRFVRMLPPTGRILDLGGTAVDDERGALVVLAYPYSFHSLTIVDLPSGERHLSTFRSSDAPRQAQCHPWKPEENRHCAQRPGNLLCA